MTAIHVFRNTHNRWVVMIREPGRSNTPLRKKDGRLVSYRWRYQAVIAGRALAIYLRAEFTAAGRNGRINLSNSYGNDPKDIPG